MYRALKVVATLLFCLLSINSFGQTLVIKGSDTLGAKLVPQIKEYYRAEHPEVAFEIAAEGSSTGISAIISSQADIGMSSRPVSQEEYSKARLNGVEIKLITVAYDGIAIIVNKNNPIDSLTKEEARQIFTGHYRNWAAVGGEAGSISVYTRNTASGTYKDFQELAMEKDDYAPNSQKLAGNEQIASEVAGNPNATKPSANTSARLSGNKGYHTAITTLGALAIIFSTIFKVAAYSPLVS